MSSQLAFKHLDAAADAAAAAEVVESLAQVGALLLSGRWRGLQSFLMCQRDKRRV
jgi:hypothetical protein